MSTRKEIESYFMANPDFELVEQNAKQTKFQHNIRQGEFVDVYIDDAALHIHAVIRQGYMGAIPMESKLTYDLHELVVKPATTAQILHADTNHMILRQVNLV